MASELSTILQQARNIQTALRTVRPMYPELSIMQRKMVPGAEYRERFPTRSHMKDLIASAKAAVKSSFFSRQKTITEKTDALSRIEEQMEAFRLFEDGALLAAPVNQHTGADGILTYHDPVGAISKSEYGPFVDSHGRFHDRFAISLMRLKHEVFLGWRHATVDEVVLEGMTALDQILYDPKSNPVSSENIPVSPLMADSIKSNLKGLEGDLDEWKEEFLPGDELVMLKSVFLTPAQVGSYLDSIVLDGSAEAFAAEEIEMREMDKAIHELDQQLLLEKSFINSYSRLLSMGPLAEKANQQILMKIKVINNMIQDLDKIFGKNEPTDMIKEDLQRYANRLRHTLTPLSAADYVEIERMSAQWTMLNNAYESFGTLIRTWPSLLRTCEEDRKADQEAILNSCQGSMKFRRLVSKVPTAEFVSQRVVMKPFEQFWDGFNVPISRDADAKCVETDLYKRTVFIIDHFMTMPNAHHRHHERERAPEQPQSPPVIKPVPELIQEQPRMRPPPRSPKLEPEPELPRVEPIRAERVQVVPELDAPLLDPAAEQIIAPIGGLIVPPIDEPIVEPMAAPRVKQSTCVIPTALSFDGSFLTEAMVCSARVDYRDEMKRVLSVKTGFSIPKQNLEDEKSRFAVAFSPFCRYRNHVLERIVKKFAAAEDKQALVLKWAKFVQGELNEEIEKYNEDKDLYVLRNPITEPENVMEPLGSIPVFVNRRKLNAIIHPSGGVYVRLLSTHKHDDYLTISERQYQFYGKLQSQGEPFKSTCPLRVDVPAAAERGGRSRLLVNQNISKLMQQLNDCKLDEVNGDYQSCLCL
eukprot:GILK01001603.1.p1 GENE.GILK01001603.1~~GILK01001603.1.p1  ORF type:complete len:862 (+),score=181.45 GILK01001603.1:152-2587(+)